MSGKVWSMGELEYLAAWYKAHAGRPLALTELARNLGRSRVAVSTMARHMGLTEHHRPAGRKPRAKYATDAERRAAVGAATRERQRLHGHPRGARGLKVSPEHLAKMQAGARRWNETATPERKAERRAKMLATRIQRHGTAGPPLRGTRAFSRAKSGFREDLQLFVRSRWEANYARYLNFLLGRGLIASWAYEARTFRFDGISRGTMTYTPDFEVHRPDGTIEYHEVKGWMDQKSRTRLDRMGRYHPDVTVVLIDSCAYSDIRKKLSTIIPGWEGP